MVIIFVDLPGNYILLCTHANLLDQVDLQDLLETLDWQDLQHCNMEPFNPARGIVCVDYFFVKSDLRLKPFSLEISFLESTFRVKTIVCGS